MESTGRFRNIISIPSDLLNLPLALVQWAYTLTFTSQNKKEKTNLLSLLPKRKKKTFGMNIERHSSNDDYLHVIRCKLKCNYKIKTQREKINQITISLSCSYLTSIKAVHFPASVLESHLSQSETARWR